MAEQIQGCCWNCGAGLGRFDIGRELDCRGCGKPTRVCRNCRWFAAGVANQCREPMAERVLEKTRANYCSFFEATPEPAGETAAADGDALKQAAEALFKL